MPFFVRYLLLQTFSVQSSAMADLLLFSEAAVHDEIVLATALEWAVICNRGPNANDWVQYLLDKGSAHPRSGAGSEYRHGALRLAAICGSQYAFDALLNRFGVPQSCREEAIHLRTAHELIEAAGSLDIDMCIVTNLFHERFCQPVFPQTAQYRAETNERLKLILRAALFVQSRFDGKIPPFLARELVNRSLHVLSRNSGTMSDVVDLLAFFVDSLGGFVSLLNSSGSVCVTRHCRNDLDLVHFSRLLVKFLNRQLLCGGTVDECPFDWVKLFRCALQNASSVATAVNELKDALQRTAVLIAAVYLWHTGEQWGEISRSDELIRELVYRDTFVGLWRLLVTHFPWVSASILVKRCSYNTRLAPQPVTEVDQMSQLIAEARCCRLDPKAFFNLGDRPNMRSLICLAAYQLNRCVKPDQFHRLPNVLIGIRGRTIPLPYLVLAHADAKLLTEAKQRRREALDGCACSFGAESRTSCRKAVATFP